jgi:hypothetical protein
VRLALPVLPAPEIESAADVRTLPTRVRIGEFLDARGTDVVAVIDERSVRTEGSVNRTVQAGLESHLREFGVRIVPLQATAIEGEVLEWQVRVNPDFPTSTARASARIKVVVRDQGGAVRFRGTFSGDASMVHPFLRVHHVQEVLGQAMTSVLGEVLRDDGVRLALQAAPEAAVSEKPLGTTARP